MELLVVLLIAALIVWWFIFRRPKETVETQPEAPYKVETPTTPAVETQTGPRLDPVAIALDLEPVVLTRRTTALDVNNDGKVNLEDVKEVVKKARKPRVSKKLDVNNDGKVNLKDVKAAVKKATTKKKPTASKKARGRKPTSK